MPSACAATLGRDLLSEASRIRSPSPGSPSRLARGTRQLSKASAAVDDARDAHLVFGAQHAKARRALLQDQRRDRALRIVDLAPFAEQQDQVGDVAAGDEDLAAVDDDVVALAVESASSCRWRRSRRRGSVMASDTRPPAAMRGSRRCFCSSLPKSISGLMPWKLVAQMMPVEAQALGSRARRRDRPCSDMRRAAIGLGHEHARSGRAR